MDGCCSVEEKEEIAHSTSPFCNSDPAAEGSQGRGLTWGLLLPLCYRGEPDTEQCWLRIQGFVDSLLQTTRAEDRLAGLFHVYIGIDEYCILFDNDAARQRLNAMFGAIHVPSTILHLRSSFRFKICRIWDHLAQVAAANGCDLFVLLGDDIRLLTAGWKQEIEARFTQLASSRCLPFGLACICFRDTSFAVFPTFPVIHRLHLEVFGGSLFPPEFINQHGDPFLFELYRRWGASEFAPEATLENTVGGSGAARYKKEAVHWRDEILSEAIARLSSWLALHVGTEAAAAGRVHCLNVVVPSYRCSVALLGPLSRLRVSERRAHGAEGAEDRSGPGLGQLWASVHILIVADNPGSASLEAVKQLQDWSPNHLVRVYVQPCNMGASLSRNAGMAQSFGDWTVLLDDDVVPEPSLLDAYLGAVIRFPKAQVYVGLTLLPEPKTFMQQALVASQMPFFYSVAQRMKHPPWGITANLCVPGRSNNIVWFSDAYPRTGGGEDVDFCLRLKELQPWHQRDEVLVSVPEAVVHHPFWGDILRQISGWAKGDVRCLRALPHSTFLAPPNWAEAVLLCGAALALRGTPLRALAYWLLLVLVSVLAAEAALGMCQVMAHTPRDLSTPRRLLVAAAAIVPAMAQDWHRLYYKLFQLHLHHLLVSFDWMDGQGTHVASTRLSLIARNILSALILAALRALHLAASSPAPPLPGVRLDLWLQACASCVPALLFVVLWHYSLRLDTTAYRQQYLQRLPPLPIHGDQVVQVVQGKQAVQAVRGKQDAPEEETPSSCSSSSSSSGGPHIQPDAPPSALAFGTPTPLVVLAYQRTGSNLLCGLLHNHPQLLMHNEVFNEARIYSYRLGSTGGRAAAARKLHDGAASGAGAGGQAAFDPLGHWDIFSRDHSPEQFLVDLFTQVPGKLNRHKGGATPGQGGQCRAAVVGDGGSPEACASADGSGGAQREGDLRPAVAQTCTPDGACGGEGGAPVPAGDAGAGAGSVPDGAAGVAAAAGGAGGAAPAPAAGSCSGPCRGVRTVGIKLFPEHWRADRLQVLQRLVADPRVKKIILKRDNYLQVYASKLRADKTGLYMGGQLGHVPLELDPAALQSFTENYDACYAYYERLVAGQGPESVHRVRYEDLASEDAEVQQLTRRGVFEFLDVDSSHVPRPLACTVKQSREPLRAHISNYEEIKFAFSTTRLAGCFD